MTQKTYDDPSSLNIKTRALLNADWRSLAAISRDYNINFYWLSKFASGKIVSPSVNRVQFLYEKLTGRSLVI